jgi:probable F420-dependent oxidoreductase
MSLIVGLPNHGDWLGANGWRALVDLAVAAEEAGVDAVSVVDHVVMGVRTDRYPYGSFPGGPEAPWLEPLTTLAAVAGATRRIGLVTGILISPLRAPALLAKTAATLDVLSGGRLVLGVGTGWQAEEYEAVGLEWARRHDLLDDGLAACAALWRRGPVTVDLPTVSFEDIYCCPRPVQDGGIPVWIGGKLTARNLRRIVTWGSGWIPAPGQPAVSVADDVRTLRTALEAAGRDPAGVRVRVTPPVVRDGGGRPDVLASMAGARELLAAGGTDVFVLLQAWCGERSDTVPLLGELVAAAAELG